MIRVLAFIIFSVGFLSAQQDFRVRRMDPIPLGAKVFPMEIEDDFFPTMLYTEAPKPYGSRLAKVKEEVQKRFPRKKSTKVASRSVAEPPVIEVSFAANGRQGGTPTDNSFAIANNGINISCVNSNLLMSDEEGSFVRSFSLDVFSDNLAFGKQKFDPRVIYDPVMNRFVMTWLAGFTSADSEILVAFSSSDDVRDEWNVYAIDGSPEGPGKWSDYPMISLTDTDFILTMNLIRENEPWETGFDKTLIYQMDKAAGYNGDPLQMTMLDGINFGNASIRNLHPVKSADTELESDQYFLSNRNFAVENDTFFLVHLTGGQSNPSVDIKFMLADELYGAPPNAQQSDGGDLQTNDARVLDAYRLGDSIQFVGNTVDQSTGKAAIYHGFVDLNNSDDLDLNIVAHPEYDLGYPGIAWTGQDESEPDGIIVAQHSSAEEPAGFSAMYMDDEWEYSDWIIVKEGLSFLDLLNGTERWGDYIGCQRKFDEPGIVWVSSMYTKADNFSYTWAAGLSEPDRPMSSITEVESKLDLSVFPNPTSDRIMIEMNIDKQENLNLALYNMEGKLIKQFFNGSPKKTGTMEYSFDLGPLDSGSYIFTALLGGKEIASRSIIKD